MTLLLAGTALAQWPRPVQVQGNVGTNEPAVFVDNTGKYIKSGSNLFATAAQGVAATNAQARVAILETNTATYAQGLLADSALQTSTWTNWIGTNLYVKQTAIDVSSGTNRTLSDSRYKATFPGTPATNGTAISMFVNDLGYLTLEADTNALAQLAAHTGNTNNPHAVTAAQLGALTSVTNHNQAWSTITGTPTSLFSYGVTNAIGDMFKADNLSGLANYGTARSNLGLNDMATQNSSAVSVSITPTPASSLWFGSTPSPWGYVVGDYIYGKYFCNQTNPPCQFSWDGSTLRWKFFSNASINAYADIQVNNIYGTFKGNADSATVASQSALSTNSQQLGGVAAANYMQTNGNAIALTNFAVSSSPYTITFATSNDISLANGNLQYYAPTNTTTIYLPASVTTLVHCLRIDVEPGTNSFSFGTNNLYYTTNTSIGVGSSDITIRTNGPTTLLFDKAYNSAYWRVFNL